MEENNHGHAEMEYSMEPHSNNKKEQKSHEEINLDELVPFKDHPFLPYEGQRFDDMVQSIQANGVYVSIIVRPISGGKYEILAGHNRVRAAKEAGLKTIPAEVREGLSEENALLIVTETNLIQRSFADLRHSERAIALATHYDAMKMKSGYRVDLLREIENLTTCAPLGRRSETREKLGAQYNLGKTTIGRYLRINKLIPKIKDRLDNGDIGIRVAEALSYLRNAEQQMVEDLLAKGEKIGINHADKLKQESEKQELSETAVKNILEPELLPAKMKSIKLSAKLLSQYFDETQSFEEIERVIAEALEQYLKKPEKAE